MSTKITSILLKLIIFLILTCKTSSLENVKYVSVEVQYCGKVVLNSVKSFYFKENYYNVE